MRAATRNPTGCGRKPKFVSRVYVRGPAGYEIGFDIPRNGGAAAIWSVLHPLAANREALMSYALEELARRWREEEKAGSAPPVMNGDSEASEITNTYVRGPDPAEMVRDLEEPDHGAAGGNGFAVLLLPWADDEPDTPNRDRELPA
jgi:hypothetical protein